MIPTPRLLQVKGRGKPENRTQTNYGPPRLFVSLGLGPLGLFPSALRLFQAPPERATSAPLRPGTRFDSVHKPT